MILAICRIFERRIVGHGVCVCVCAGYGGV